MSNAPAGWYPSPEDPTQNRFWDGLKWTEHQAPVVAPPPAPAASTAPLLPPPPAPPASLAAAPAGAKKKWLIGGAIAAGVIVVGSVGAAIGAGGNRETAPQASTPPVVVETTEPAVVEPTAAPVPTQEAVDAVTFRAQAASHLDDMVKDLDDMVVTVQEDGFWRLLSNNGELAFNLGQLKALDVPVSVAATWPESLTALETTLDALTDAVSTQDGPSILAAIEVVRAQVEASRGVVNSAL